MLQFTFKVRMGPPGSPSHSCLSKLFLYEPAHSLRSSARAFLVFSQSRLKGFVVRAPRLWRSLPEEIRQTASWNFFKSLLKARFVITVMLLFFSFSTWKSWYSPNIMLHYYSIVISVRQNGRHVLVYRSRLNVYMPPEELLIFKLQIFLLHTDMWVARYRYGRTAIYTNSIWVRWIHSRWKHWQLMRFYTRVNQKYLFHCTNHSKKRRDYLNCVVFPQCADI